MNSSFDGELLAALKKYADSSSDLIWFITEKDLTVTGMSARFAELTGRSGDTNFKLNEILTGQTDHLIEKVNSGTDSLTLDLKGRNGIDFSIKCTFVSTGSGYMIFGDRYHVTGEEILMSMTKLNNELSTTMRELDRKNKELEDAKNKIKVLSGLLPVCSYCKKIRNEDESWSQLESYIDKHSEAEFSHTICPTCMDKYFPE
ncbi:MAG: hypothetical protein JXN63_02910 [Candidatus Delongbacteria bacterium]|nr:hypothetical protein [Candidatus Delongbacteria bacterium]